MNHQITQEQEILNSFLKKHNKINKILLIRVPSINYETFDIQQQKKTGYMTYQPISITTLAATLRNQLPQVELKLFDAEYETLKKMFHENKKENILKETVEKVIKEFKPDLVGLSVVFSVGINNGFKIMQMINKINRKIMVLFGGIHCTFDYEDIIKRGADMVFLKEADHTFPAFIKYARGEASFDSSVHGFAYRTDDDNGFKKIEYSQYPDFKNLPRPAWDLVDTGNYHKVTQVSGLKKVINEKAPTAIVQTVRGCLARCTFCSVRNFNGFGVRSRKTQDVVDELEYLVKNFNIKYVEIVDDDFTTDHKRAVEICKEIVKRKLNITWSLNNGIRLMTITEELAENLIAAGCKLIAVGVESGNKEILHKIKKPLTLPGLYKKMEMMKKYPEIYIEGNFIVGFPFEKYNQLQDTYKVMYDLDWDWCVISIYSPLIGTEAIGYMDKETQDQIRYSETNYGTTDFIPDGFNTIKEFNNEVYINNLRRNFLENRNFLNKRFGVERAIEDYKRIIYGVDSDHAVAIHCLSKLGKYIGFKEAENYRKKCEQIVKKSGKWQYFFDKLGLKDTLKNTKEFNFLNFRSGKEIEGKRFT